MIITYKPKKKKFVVEMEVYDMAVLVVALLDGSDHARAKERRTTVNRYDCLRNELTEALRASGEWNYGEEAQHDTGADS